VRELVHRYGQEIFLLQESKNTFETLNLGDIQRDERAFARKQGRLAQRGAAYRALSGLLEL
jgi:hypothetical protein